MSKQPNEPETTVGLFDLVWTTLVDILGTAATAALLRRAVSKAVSNRPDLHELRELKVIRDGHGYEVSLPESWKDSGEQSREAFRYLVREELCPLLFELTGPVVVRKLQRVPELNALMGARRGGAEA
ncbi:MAG: hypothetical protein ACOCVR_01620 [Myxococcota bacterium]